MKKSRLLVLLFPLLTLSGCYFDVNPADVMDPQYGIRKIYMGSGEEVVEVGEKKFVEVEVQDLGPGGKVSTLTYTSTNPNVASAKFGRYEDEEAEYEGVYISGKNIGVTSIIASFKEASASTKVTVINSDDIPFIHLKNTELSLEVGSEYVLPCDIIYKKENFDILENEIYFDFDVVEGYDEIADIYQDEETNEIVINPLQVGKSQILVSTTFKDKFTSTLLELNVIEEGVGIVISNDGFIPSINNSYVTKLYVSDYGEFSSSLTLDLKLFKGNTEISDVISLTSDNSDVVSVNGYVLQAHSVGSTIVRGSYEGIDLSILVTVGKPVLQTSILSSYIEVERNPKFKILNKEYITSDITGLYLNEIDEEHNVFASFDGEEFTFNMDPLRKLVNEFGKEQKLIIETEEIFIDAGLVDIYSDIITTYDELASLGELAGRYIQNKFDFNGYFVLGNNITCPEEGTPVALNRDTNFKIGGIGDCNGTNVGFNGIFDGQGYTIKNYMPVGFGSFITYLTKDGVMKNVGFEDARLDVRKVSTAPQPIASVIACGEGIIENIYVNYKSVYTGLAFGDNRYCTTFSGIGMKTLQAKSVLVRGDKAVIDGDFDILGKLTNCNGVYSIGGTHINNDSLGTNNIFYCSGIFKAFESEALMKDDLATNARVMDWNTSFWNKLETGVPEWKSKGW